VVVKILVKFFGVIQEIWNGILRQLQKKRLLLVDVLLVTMIQNGDAMIVIIDGGKEMNKIVNKKFSDDVSIEIQLLKEAIARRNITNHNITYYKQNDYDIVESKQKISISYMKALNEMEKLNWNLFNHIGFENHYTKEVL